MGKSSTAGWNVEGVGVDGEMGRNERLSSLIEEISFGFLVPF